MVGRRHDLHVEAERYPLLERGQQGEDLGRRTGLHADAAVVSAVHRVVDVPAGAVRAVDRDCPYLAGARLDQHLRRGVAGRVERRRRGRDHVTHRVLGGMLVLRVHRGVNLQAALVVQLGPRLVIRGVVLHDGNHVVAEVRGVLGRPAGAAALQRVEGRMQAERGVRRGLRLVLGDVMLLRHLRKHFVAPADRVARELQRVVLARVFYHASQQRRLGQCQFPGRGVEVALRRQLDADRMVVEVGGVEIRGKQLVLGQLVLDLDGNPQLADLPRRRVLLGGQLSGLGRRRQDQGILHVLLRDR